MEELIKDYYGRIIARTEKQPNGDIVVKDFYYRIVGKYEAMTDTTRDFYGRVVAQGNAVGLLIGMCNTNNN